MTETAHMLDDTADRLFSRTSGGEIADAWDEAGLSLTLAPEENGGLGASLAEAAVIAYRAGQHGTAFPVVERLLLGMLLPAAEAEILAEGRGVRAERHDDGWRLVGPDLRAPQPGDGAWLVPALGPEGRGIAVVQPSDSVQEIAMSGDLWRRVSCAAAPVQAFHALPEQIRLDQAGALLSACVMAGAMRFMLDTAVEHVTTRKQFGRPLAKFQAIQHQLADAAAERVLTEAVLGEALRRYDQGNDPIQTWAAKLQAGRAARVIAMAAHQTMGAIAYTREHPMHAYTGRVWDLRDLWGREADLETYVGHAAASAGAAVWPLVVGAGGQRSTGETHAA